MSSRMESSEFWIWDFGFTIEVGDRIAELTSSAVQSRATNPIMPPIPPIDSRWLAVGGWQPGTLTPNPFSLFLPESEKGEGAFGIRNPQSTIRNRIDSPPCPPSSPCSQEMALVLKS